jgi:hypothetical protein
MSLKLRVDVEKPYGNHTLVRKVVSKLIENYYPTAPKFCLYLDHLTEFLRFLKESNVKATFYHRLCNLPTQNLVKYYQDHGHQLGLHFENSRSLETLKKELVYFEKEVKVTVKTISKHGSGSYVLGKNHYPHYEPDKYLIWAKQLNVVYPSGNGIPCKLEDLSSKDGYFENVFWIEPEYRDMGFSSIKGLLQAAKQKDVIVLVHPESYFNYSLVRRDLIQIIEQAKILGIEWKLL